MAELAASLLQIRRAEQELASLGRDREKLVAAEKDLDARRESCRLQLECFRCAVNTLDPDEHYYYVALAFDVARVPCG